MNNRSLRPAWQVLAALPLVLSSLTAAAAEGQGAYLDLRYRHEQVDQQGLARDAGADTLRLRSGYRSGSWHGWSALAEADAVVELGGGHYNDTRNGRSQYPVIADQAGAAFNQALVRHVHATTSASIGRQRINLGNQRFVGGSAWRQNEQTFDGVRLQWQPAPALALDYTWLDGISTVFGPADSAATTRANGAHIDGRGHLLQASARLAPTLSASAYHHRLDLEGAAVGATAPAGTLASRTSGLRLEGRHAAWSYAAEYARQRELERNPWQLDSRYRLLEFGYSVRGAVLKAGFESLGGGEGVGNRAFQTPLATKHAFQGWADVFLVTPAAGVDDRYAGISVPLAGGSLQAWYHDFVPERGGGSYGREVDLSWSRPVAAVPGLTGLAKLAHYRSDDAARTADVDKLWLQLQYTY